MSALRSILQEYLNTAVEVDLGADETQAPALPTDAPKISPGADETQTAGLQHTPAPELTDARRSKLKRHLDALNQDNRRYFTVCVAMIVILFVVSVVVVLGHLNDRTVVQTALMAFGVSSTGLIIWMIRIWRIKTNTEFFMLLATQTDSDTMRMLIRILADKV